MDTNRDWQFFPTAYSPPGDLTATYLAGVACGRTFPHMQKTTAFFCGICALRTSSL